MYGLKNLKYGAAIFDFDGTLADSVQWCLQAMNGMADKFGFKKIGPDEEDLVRGYSTQQLLKHLGLPMWKLPMVVVEMRKVSARDIGQIKLFPGVTEMLRGLNDAGIKVGIVTSNSKENVAAVMTEGNMKLVQEFSCGASLLGKAPKLKAMCRKFALAPGEAIYIGDEIRDATAATSTGMAFGSVSWGYAKFDALSKQRPALEFRKVEEIVPALRQAR